MTAARWYDDLRKSSCDGETSSTGIWPLEQVERTVDVDPGRGDTEVAERVHVGLEVGVVGQRARARRVGVLVGLGLGLRDDRVVAGERETEVGATAVRSAASLSRPVLAPSSSLTSIAPTTIGSVAPWAGGMPATANLLPIQGSMSLS